MLHAVIMAGGAGTRFWPASREARPKQLLALAGKKPLLRATFDRIESLAAPGRVWVVTGSEMAAAVRELLPEVPPANVLCEPCVGLAALVASQSDPEAVCVVVPADHVIPEADRLRSALAAGARLVAEEGGLLTFGVRPTRPETGYGYLEVGSHYRTVDGWDVHRLERFQEKPDLETARRYAEGGAHLWNSGMFAWRAADLLAEIERQLPLLAGGLQRIGSAPDGAGGGGVLEQVYPTLPRVSVDFGVMEGARTAWTVPVDFGWSDVGSWPALAEALGRDSSGNVTRGRVVALDTARSVLIGEGPVVAAVEVDGLIVVATPDAVLIAPVDAGQRVKDIVARLAELGWTDVL